MEAVVPDLACMVMPVEAGVVAAKENVPAAFTIPTFMGEEVKRPEEG